ncbi:hypothetical protein Hanom_Chr09g00768521 [Helianthus anomalus]
MAKLDISDRGVENVYTKNFYKTGGSKTYIPKKIYTKTHTLHYRAKSSGGRPPPPAPSRPHKATPLQSR